LIRDYLDLNVSEKGKQDPQFFYFSHHQEIFSTKKKIALEKFEKEQ